MKKRQLGHSGIEVPTLCFGGNVFGWTADEQRSFELLDALLESGLNFVDTADSYSHWAPGNHGGESETILGKWFKARGNRSQVILATKVGSPMGEGKKGLSRHYITAGGGGFAAAACRPTTSTCTSRIATTRATPQAETLGIYAELIAGRQGARHWSFQLYRGAVAVGVGSEPQAQPAAL